MGSTVSTIMGNGYFVEVDNNPKPDEDVTVETIGKNECIVVEVEPGTKFVRNCETTEKTLKCHRGRPVEVLKTSKAYSQEDITKNEEVSRKPYAEKYVKGESKALVGCAVDDDLDKLPELVSYPFVAELDSVEEMEQKLVRKQYIANKIAHLQYTISNLFNHFKEQEIVEEGVI